MNTPIVYGIPHCDSVKKARAWFSQRGLDFEFHDFKKQGVPQARLAHWLKDCGWEAVLNRKGTTWRRLEPAAQAAVTDEASARRLMLELPSVIKRPVIEWPSGATTVGYLPEQWPA